MADPQEYIIWNGLLGVLDMVTIGRVEVGENGERLAFLKNPYDMVGPFSLDELETRGVIAFAACQVMSRERWKEDQADLRREAREKRREQAERMREAQARFYDEHEEYREEWRRRRAMRLQLDEREYRAVLDLPTEGVLAASEINAAFRRLAKKAHPDGGGSHELFIRITEARDALLEGAS